MTTLRLGLAALLLTTLLGCGTKSTTENPVKPPPKEPTPSGPAYTLMAWGAIDCVPCHPAFREIASTLEGSIGRNLIVDMKAPKAANEADVEAFKNDLNIPSFKYSMDAKWEKYRQYVQKSPPWIIPAAVLLNPQGEVVKKYPPGDFVGSEVAKDIQKQIK